jgi:serine phosphatase RsbU (regulator of sigma subunit)/ligand-binding sensor domain-containing protein
MCRFVNMLFRLKFLILIIFLPLLLRGQGKNFMRTYSQKEYDAHAQNWCVIQDTSGLIYVGNTIGLLIYDGNKWQSVKLNNSIVRSLAKDSQNKIYYGAQGEFGYLVSDNKGRITNKSLNHLLPDSLKIFGDVWKTYCYQSKVIFQTFDYIYIYENNKITVVEAENNYHFGYQRNEDFYIIDREIGLKKLVKNSVVLIPGGEFFANLRIYGWINYKDYCLLLTREKGIFKVIFNKDEAPTIEAFKTEIDEDLINGEVYCATQLSNGNIGFGTLQQGFYITSNEGKLIKVINKKNGLKCEIIKACFEDRQKGLWLALDVGISRIEINSEFQFLNEDDGLEGIVNAAVNFNGKIYCGTTKGLFEIDNQQIKRYNNFNNDIRNILKINHDGKEWLLLLSEIGTFKLDQENKLNKLNDEDGYFIVESKFHKNNFFLGTSKGLCIMNLNTNTLIDYYNSPMPEVRRIAEENDSLIWLGTTHHGVYSIKNVFKQNYEVQSYDTTKGLPHNTNDLPFSIKDRVLFGTIQGIYEFNKATQKFIKANNFASQYYNENDQIFQIVETNSNNVWLFKTNEILHEFILYNTKSNTSNFPLRRMGEFDAYQCIYPENENITWFGGPDGLFRYDASKPSMDSIPYKTKIRGVYCMNDTLFGGYYGFNENGEKIETQPETFIPELIYKSNNINFDFAALSFDNEKENVYSYYLEGFENTWSDWTSESKKSYTNLNEGTYTFHIKSKNVYGKEGNEDTYTFTILPPWYRTGWAYFAYAMGAIFLVYLITQISVRRLKSAKIKLEAIVVNRTAEVVAEKEEVEKQKKIVEVKNKDITDSINYAQRIQQAILPLPEDISKVFPESFIYFQPRDIVSGDFYWFYTSKRKDKKWVYIAAADCTGHGVPGAFMSMIGNTLLNEILNEKQIYETDQILNQLHIEVRAALKQDTAQNTTNDGMDIALVRVDLDTLELQFSGANRALYIFKNEKEFVDIKPNKFPIGGYQAETTRSFTAHLIQLQHKDTFYIFSDGYADQFGGASNKKFMVKRLQNELMAMQNLPMHEQKYLVQKLVMDWKGDAEQVDDILLIGVKI